MAQVSTMVFAPTCAPMLTYEGIITTPGARWLPHRADAPGTTRTPAAWKPLLSGILSAYSNGPSSTVSMADRRNSSRMACLSHSLTVTWSPSDLGHPGLAPVEQVDRLA